MLAKFFLKHLEKVFFIFWALIISLIQYILLKPVMTTGLALDDWGGILAIYSLMPLTLGKIINSWSYFGIHHTMQFFYVDTLFTIFKFDYPSYNIINIIFKIIATFSFFPLILIIFKRKCLAFLVTTIHAISYTSTGALIYVLQGAYYIGIIFMNIFFIFYLWTVTKKSTLYLFLAAFSLILAYWFAPGRIYPILFFILLIEFFLNMKFEFKNMVIKSMARLAIFYLPIILLIWTGGKDYSQLGTPSQTFQDVINGNWRVALNPLSGLGYLFLPGDYWRIFGDLNIQGFGDFFNFLVRENLLILIPITIFLSHIIFKNILKYSLLILSANFIVSILFFFIATHHLTIPVNLRVDWDESVFWREQYYSLFGIYVLTISSACLLAYFKKSKGNLILLAAAVGPIFAFIFLLGPWIVLGRVMTFYGGVNRYFPFASLGASLFIGAILSLMSDRIKRWGIVLIISFLLLFFLVSIKEINIGFIGTNVRNSYLHKHFQENFIKQLNLKEVRYKQSVLFYFELPDEEQKKYFEQAFDSYNFSRWMYLRLGATDERCIGIIDDESRLTKTVRLINGEYTFSYPNTGCIRRRSTISSFQADEEINFKFGDFYAFRVVGANFTDITTEVLQKLKIK